ncbi:hypothetical protein M8R20_14980 [Pseudomonas sp. R2.Fl]|nr:hypothetical protein [Pseudomonas sp. R2.Fl]
MLAVFAALASAMLLPAAQADAHSPRAPVDTSGVDIAPLSHGQMGVIARHRDEIVAMAAWFAADDEQVRKLLAFSHKQYARCFWGLMPGSIADEESPFNECSHAYLAADQALLVRMRELPEWPEITAALFDRVERDMIANQSSLSLCAFSATPFNTASLTDPDWHDFLTHTPSLLTTLAAGTLVPGGILLAGWRVYRAWKREDEGAALRQV